VGDKRCEIATDTERLTGIAIPIPGGPMTGGPIPSHLCKASFPEARPSQIEEASYADLVYELRQRSLDSPGVRPLSAQLQSGLQKLFVENKTHPSHS
jgi:hypothetical protein